MLQQQFDFRIYCKWCICSIGFGRRLLENWHRNCVYIAKGGCVKINSKWAFKYCFKIISMSFLDGQSVSFIWFHSLKMSHEQIKSPIDTSTYINPTNCRCNSWLIYANVNFHHLYNHFNLFIVRINLILETIKLRMRQKKTAILFLTAKKTSHSSRK